MSSVISSGQITLLEFGSCMHRFYLLGISLLVLGHAVSAQSSDRFEIFGGYSYLSGDFTTVTNSGINGWNASLNAKVKPWAGIVADFSAYYPSANFGCGQFCTTSAKPYSFLFGPQVSLPFRRVAPFAQFLVGDTYVSSSGNSLASANSFTFAVGGGIDFQINRHFALRGQVGLFHNGFTASDNQLQFKVNHNPVRASTGLVFRF